MTVPIPTLGLGCAALGNLHQPRSDDEAQKILEAAWRAGVRHFDTAPHYGLGLSEVRLGRFLSNKPKDEFVVSTKVGRLLRPNPEWDGVALDDQGFSVPARLIRDWDVSYAGMRASLEGSLNRLQLDRVDLIYLHDPEHSDIDSAVPHGMEALGKIRAEGLADAIGIGSMTPAAIKAAVETGVADLAMVAGRYTLLDQTVHPDVLAACSTYDTGIVAAAVFNSGLLSASPSATSTFDYGEVTASVLRRAHDIELVCRSHGVDLPTAAMHFPLIDTRVRAVVVGADNAAQVQQNAARLQTPVPRSLWEDLYESGLVTRCA